LKRKSLKKICIGRSGNWACARVCTSFFAASCTGRWWACALATLLNVTESPNFAELICLLLLKLAQTCSLLLTLAQTCSNLLKYRT
jgi:hypothetical protein